MINLMVTIQAHEGEPTPVLNPYSPYSPPALEQLRGPDSIDSKDMFTFNFELHSLAHGEWIDAVGTI